MTSESFQSRPSVKCLPFVSLCLYRKILPFSLGLAHYVILNLTFSDLSFSHRLAILRRPCSWTFLWCSLYFRWWCHLVSNSEFQTSRPSHRWPFRKLSQSWSPLILWTWRSGHNWWFEMWSRGRTQHPSCLLILMPWLLGWSRLALQWSWVYSTSMRSPLLTWRMFCTYKDSNVV